MSNYRDQLEQYLKRLDIKADRVLDVGGAALPVKDRVRSWEVNHYKIADNGLEKGEYDYEMELNDAYYDQEFGYYGVPATYDLEELMDFDVVFCLEVMEYINNADIAVGFLSETVNKTGTLYITFPFIYPTHNPVSNDYARYTFMGAMQLLTTNGFEIEEVVPRYMKSESFGLFQQFLHLEGMHAAKGVAHNELGWIFKCKKI